MRKLLASLLALTALSPVSASAETLDSMLKSLAKDHPRIEAAKADLSSRNAAKEEAFSGYLPKADLSAATGYEEVDRTDLSPAGSETEETASSYSASITQNVFEGGRTQAAVNSATAYGKVAEFGLTSIQQQVIYEGASSYLEVLRFIELTQLATDNQENLRQQLHLEDERVKRGSGIAVDALQAKSRLQVSRERYTAFLGGLKDAVSRYTQVFNNTPDVDNMELPAIPEKLLPASMEEAINIAVSRNPQLAGAKENVEVTGYARDTAKSGYFPSIDIVGSSGYDDNVSGVLGEEYDTSLKIQSTWQIFSGFADRSRVRQSAFNYESAVETSQYTQRKVVEEVKLAWSALTTSKERADLLENAVNIAGEVFDARKRLRDAGSETALNVLDAENELYRARIDAASARYDYYISVYRLLLSMGMLNFNTAAA